MIDFVFEQDQTLYPLEVKLGALPKREWVGQFGVLEGLNRAIGEGGVLCLCPEPLPLSTRATAVPVGLL